MYNGQKIGLLTVYVGSFILHLNKNSSEGKYEGRRLHGRPRHRWEDNIEMDLKEMGWEGMDEIIWLRTQTNGGVL